MAIGSTGGFTYLYSANFHSGNIDVLKGSAGAPAWPDISPIPACLPATRRSTSSTLGGQLYVAYAQTTPGSADEIAGPGLGFVDAFDLNGNFLRRVATGGALNAPWGLALAPASWVQLAGKLLVGNFGDGAINAYDPVTGASAGALLDANGHPLCDRRPVGPHRRERGKRRKRRSHLLHRRPE